MSRKLTIRDLPDHFISRGRYVVSKDEIAALAGLKDTGLRSGLSRLKAQKKLFSPARGLYVFVPPDYRTWGVVPADWFVDEMMDHLGRSYYVGLLSAAARHGAAHQSPQVFEIVTDDELKDRDLKRVRLRFFTSSLVQETPVEEHRTHTGTIKVSTREATVIDLIDRPRAAAGFSNVATILEEIGPLDSKELTRLSGLRPRSHARRLGWMLGRFSPETDTSELRELAQPKQGAPTPLSGGAPRRGEVDPRWGLLLNTTVESDLE